MNVTILGLDHLQQRSCFSARFAMVCKEATFSRPPSPPNCRTSFEFRYVRGYLFGLSQRP